MYKASLHMGSTDYYDSICYMGSKIDKVGDVTIVLLQVVVLKPFQTKGSAFLSLERGDLDILHPDIGRRRWTYYQSNLRELHLKSLQTYDEPLFKIIQLLLEWVSSSFGTLCGHGGYGLLVFSLRYQVL